MQINARSAFIGIAIVLVALVVGVPILGAMFAQGGPFGQLVGVTEGTCEYVPSGTFSSQIVDLKSDEYAVLDRRIVVSDGTPLQTLTVSSSTQARKAKFGVDSDTPTVDNTKETYIQAGDISYLIGLGTNANLGSACSASPDAETRKALSTAVPVKTTTADTPTEGRSIVLTDAQLADNRYSGILSAIILLIPLAVVVYFAMRFIQGRMGR